MSEVTAPVIRSLQHQVAVILHPWSTAGGPGVVVVGADVDPVVSAGQLRLGDIPGVDQGEAGDVKERQHGEV